MKTHYLYVFGSVLIIVVEHFDALTIYDFKIKIVVCYIHTHFNEIVLLK